jgi:excisionase family DNA binding protein
MFASSMNHLTFEQLPEAVYNLQQNLGEIERLLHQIIDSSGPDLDQIMTVTQAAEFLDLSVSTVYGLISKRELPVMKRSKRCYFSRQELMEYLKAGRRRTNAEIEAEAELYLRDKKRSLRRFKS